MYSPLFIFVALAAASAGNIPQFETWRGYQEGDRFFYFPGDDGKIYLVDAGEVGGADENYKEDSYDVGYWLYTRSNPHDKQELIMGNKRSVYRSYFDPNKITVVVSHGWKSDGNSEINRVLKKAFLNDSDVNVIVFDWGATADENYNTAKCAVVRIGKMLGRFIDWLRQEFQLSLNKVHLVGHSLGAHLVGNAGNLLNGDVKRITALDPAGPLWYKDKHRVSAHDARYVEVIHTNAFMCGYPLPIGHADHYPNGGEAMPGCSAADIVCHHARSWRYLAASVERDQFKAHQCEDVTKAFDDQCIGAMGKMGNSDIRKKHGHTDLYPNGGETMPGYADLDIACHHARSWRYLAASVERDQFTPHQCKDVTEAFDDQCIGAMGKMGNSDISKEQYGIYRINTKPDYPYI